MTYVYTVKVTRSFSEGHIIWRLSNRYEIFEQTLFDHEVPKDLKFMMDRRREIYTRGIWDSNQQAWTILERLPDSRRRRW